MGNILSQLWPSLYPVRGGVAIIREARDVAITGGTFNAVQGDQTVTNLVLNLGAIPGTVKGGKTAIEKIRKKLKITNFPTIQQTTYAHRIPETGLWFLQTDQYSDWWTAPGKVLWATGIPGAGKTHIAACAINDALEKAQTRPNVSVTYAYFQHSDPKPVLQVLQSVVRQQAEYCPEGAERVAALAAHREAQGMELSELDCICLLKYMSDKCDMSMHFLDGLDEAPPDAQFDIIEVFSSIKANVCIFSRPLERLQAKLQQTLEDVTFMEISAQDQDLELLIEQKIDRTLEFSYLLGPHPELRREIVRKLKQNAGGMFLHAAFQIEELRFSTSISDLMSKLNTFPRGIEGMYAATLERINAQPPGLADLARKVLTWFAFVDSDRMANDCFPRALATDFGTRDPPEGYEPPSTIQLLAACCGLLTHASRQFRLVHVTANEALQRLLRQWCPFPHTMVICSLARSPPTPGYFSATDEEIMKKHTRSGMLDDEPNLQDHALKFLRKLEDGSALWMAAKWGILSIFKTLVEDDKMDINSFCQSNDINATALQAAVLFRQISIVEYLMKRPDIDPELRHSPLFETPLITACRLNDEESVSILLRHPGTNPNHGGVGDSALLIALRNGNLEIASKILDSDSELLNINAFFHLRDVHGSSEIVVLNGKVHKVDEKYTILTYTLETANLQLALMALRHKKVDINLTDSLGRTPLIIACKNGYDQIIPEILTFQQVNANHVDQQGGSALTHLLGGTSYLRTTWVEAISEELKGAALLLLDIDGIDPTIGVPPALHLAASRDPSGDIVQRLLEFDQISVNVTDEHGNSALLRALWQGHESAALHILDTHTAIINQTNSTGATPLILACLHGLEEVVGRLLEFVDIEVNHVSMWGDSALTAALKGFHPSIVHCLLDHPGIDADVEGGIAAGRLMWDASEVESRAEVIGRLKELKELRQGS